MAFSWKVLIPASLVNLLLVAVGVVTNLYVMAGLELVAAVVFIWLVARIGVTAGDDIRAAAKAAEVSA
jgi:hypothetical protein